MVDGSTEIFESNETAESTVTAESIEIADVEANCNPCQKFIEVDRLARAYVPIQKMCQVFPPEKGLKLGTIYPELNMPYDVSRGRAHGDKSMMIF